MKKISKIDEMRVKTRLKKKNALKIEKRKLGLNQILKPLLFFVCSLVLEIVSFLIFKFKTPSGSIQVLPQYILFDIGTWLIVCAFMLCSPINWLSNLIFILAFFVEGLMFCINLTLKMDFGYLFSLDMFRLIGEAAESIDVSFINYRDIILIVVGVAVVIAVPILFDKLFSKKRIELKKISRPIFCLLFFLISLTVGAGCYTAQTALLKTSDTYAEISSDKYLYENQNISDTAYMKFGSCGFYLKGLANLLFPNNCVSKTEQAEALETYKKSEISKDTTASQYGDNLIMIMLESFEWFAIDPYNTPNLWALKTGTASENVNVQATIFTNYVSNNKTNISEDLGILGYMPSENTFSVKSKNVYATKYSLPNLFKDCGYETSFFHNWKINFYNRNTTNKNIGFDNIYSLKDFENENKSTRFNFYNLESDFIRQFMNQLAPTDKKFMSFYTTVATHGTYTIINEQFNKYYEKYDANLENFKTWFTDNGYHYPTSEKEQAVLREYKSAAMDTDEMVGELFKHLDETGLINNTTVVLYADHNSFYQDLSYEVKSTNKNDYSSQKSYTVPLMIYSSKLTPSTISEFCSPYDLYPTISGLFGLGYNTFNAQGKDLLSNEISETVYYSHMTGFYNSKCYSKNMQYIQTYEGATASDIENFKNQVCEFLKKQRVLNIVYKSNATC